MTSRFEKCPVCKIEEELVEYWFVKICSACISDYENGDGPFTEAATSYIMDKSNEIFTPERILVLLDNHDARERLIEKFGEGWLESVHAAYPNITAVEIEEMTSEFGF